jgi:hypothetical protein
MIRKVFSIVFFVIAGFFFYMVGLLGFVSEPSILAKWGIVLGFTSPAAIALLAGLALGRFRCWKRNTGIVLLSSMGVSLFVVLTFFCLLMTEEFRMMMTPDTLAYFRDYYAGSAVIAGFTILGLILLKLDWGQSSKLGEIE